LLNQESFINLANFETLEDFTEKVKEVHENDELWMKIASQPLLQKRPSLDQVIEVLKHACRPLIGP
jgi:hypothetical protein